MPRPLNRQSGNAANSSSGPASTGFKPPVQLAAAPTPATSSSAVGGGVTAATPADQVLPRGCYPHNGGQASASLLRTTVGESSSSTSAAGGGSSCATVSSAESAANPNPSAATTNQFVMKQAGRSSAATTVLPATDPSKRLTLATANGGTPAGGSNNNSSLLSGIMPPASSHQTLISNVSDAGATPWVNRDGSIVNNSSSSSSISMNRSLMVAAANNSSGISLAGAGGNSNIMNTSNSIGGVRLSMTNSDDGVTVTNDTTGSKPAGTNSSTVWLSCGADCLAFSAFRFCPCCGNPLKACANMQGGESLVNLQVGNGGADSSMSFHGGQQQQPEIPKPTKKTAFAIFKEECSVNNSLLQGSTSAGKKWGAMDASQIREYEQKAKDQFEQQKLEYVAAVKARKEEEKAAAKALNAARGKRGREADGSNAVPAPAEPKPKKAPSAYMVFLSEKRAEVKKAVEEEGFPTEIQGDDKDKKKEQREYMFKTIAGRVSALWKDLSEEEKASYKGKPLPGSSSTGPDNTTTSALNSTTNSVEPLSNNSEEEQDTEVEMGGDKTALPATDASCPTGQRPEQDEEEDEKPMDTQNKSVTFSTNSQVVVVSGESAPAPSSSSPTEEEEESANASPKNDEDDEEATTTPKEEDEE